MVIGLTGGIATGKSTVAQMLAAAGAVIIDADQIAREVVEPNEPVLERIKERFGEDVVDENGSLLRHKLGAIVFNDEQSRNDLNQIIHPAIRTQMLRRKQEAVQNGAKLVVLDIPLLFENKLEHMVEKVLVVYIPESLQLQRLMARDQISEQEALQKMSSQMPIEQKKYLADAYIDNSGSYLETEKQLTHIIKMWGAQEMQ